MQMKLHMNPLLRWIGLPLLKLVNRDIFINHPWTRDKLKLSLFEHKGYWFYRRNRERDEMIAFGCLLSPGAHVLEVGGHIGFTSLYFANLVAPSGKVIVFEPGPNNLEYIRFNIATTNSIILEAAGCSDQDGEAILYMDNLTGQNNSLVSDFEGLTANAQAAPGVQVETMPVRISTIKIDTYCEQSAYQPDFIKIDVEGHELAVLRGAERLLSSGNPPMLMVEVQADHQEIIAMLRNYDYRLFSASGEMLGESFTGRHGNVFALNPVFHKEKLEAWLKQLRYVS
jgi:FkbM family methyltransferase